MQFNPQSTICLCNVPIDNTYHHQIFFNDRNEQKEYFYNRVRKTFANYLTVRKSLPDGSLNSFIRVDANIETLFDCNYMYYTNEHHGNKTFYAFITQLIYINEGTTEIRFETDVFQTWYFERVLKPSFVVREHTKTDKIGEHIVPEKFSFQEYEYWDEAFMTTDDSAVKYLSDLNRWGYLIGSTESLLENDVRGWEITGVYQGFHLYFYESINAVNNLLITLEQKKETCIQFILHVPRLIVGQIDNVYVDGNGEIKTDEAGGGGKVNYSGNSFLTRLKFNLANSTPFTMIKTLYKNRKILSSPYCYFTLGDNAGNELSYFLDEFEDITNIEFELHASLTSNPSIFAFPLNYKGITENYDHGLTINNFPQCSYDSDTYRLWLAKNQGGNVIKTITAGVEVAGGIVALATGVGTFAGVAGIIHGATSLGSIVNENVNASRLPDKVSGGNSSNGILSVQKKYRFTFKFKCLKEAYLKMIDEYFTLYGYQVNTLKTPSINNRPYYTYVQTAGCNIVTKVNDLAIPDDDLRKLKGIFDAGLTVWKSTATIGDYSVDNSPT